MVCKTITVDEIKQLLEQGRHIDLVDVRSPREYQALHAQGARLVPMGSLTPEAVLQDREAGSDDPIYIICQSGGRSRIACWRLQRAGVSNVVNVAGGTAAWRRAGLPVEGTGGSGWWSGWRIFGLLLVVVGLVLGWVYSPWFGVIAVAGWAAMMAGGGVCGMGSCSLPQGSRQQHP